MYTENNPVAAGLARRPEESLFQQRPICLYRRRLGGTGRGSFRVGGYWPAGRRPYKGAWFFRVVDLVGGVGADFRNGDGEL